MTLQTLYILFTFLFSLPQQDCKVITKDKELFQSLLTKSYTLEKFGSIPADKYSGSKNEVAFSIDNKCLQFSIRHMGCDCTFEIYWDGKYRTDKENRSTVDLKFILSYKDPCKRLNRTDLKFDLKEILDNCKGDRLFVNFIGYDKLVQIK